MKSNSLPDLPRRAALATLLAAVVSSGCSVRGTMPNGRAGSFTGQFIKTDFDHVVEAAQRRIFASLLRLTEKLYRRNPREWRKSGAESVELALARIFDSDHGWHFGALGGQRDIQALMLAFDPVFRGDRVLAFAVGMGSMVQTAFGNKVGFYLLNELEPQAFYNAAKNVEIAAWKLASTYDTNGNPLLLSNEMGAVTNLSFEREFGRIIGALEILTDIVEKKTERIAVRVAQSLTTAVFLPMP